MGLEDKLKEKAENKIDSKIESVREKVANETGLNNVGDYDKLKNDVLENFKSDVKFILNQYTQEEANSSDVAELRELIRKGAIISPPEADFSTDDFKKLCIDPVSNIVFPTIADLIEAFHKIYCLPSIYLDEFNLKLPNFKTNLHPTISNRPNWQGFPDFQNIKIPALEYDFAISQAYAQLPQLIINELLDIIDKILEAIEGVLDTILPSPLFTIGGGSARVSFYITDILDPIAALLDKVKQLLPISNIFDGQMGILLRDKTLADLLGFNIKNVFNGFDLDGITLADLRISISFADFSKLEELAEELKDVLNSDNLRYFVRLADLTVKQFVDIVAKLGIRFQDLQLPEFVGRNLLSQIGVNKIFSFSIFDIVDELSFPNIQELLTDFIDDITDFEIPGFNIPGLDVDFKFFDSLNIPELRYNLTVQALQIEITKITMNLMEQAIIKLVDLIKELTGQTFAIPKSLFLQVMDADEILDFLRGVGDLELKMSILLGDLTMGDLFPDRTIPLDRLNEFISDLILPDGRILGTLTWEEFLEILPKGIKFGELKFPDGFSITSIGNILINGFTLSDLASEIDQFGNWVGEAMEKLRNFRLGGFPLFKLPDPILPPGIFNPELELKMAIQYIRMSMANWKVNIMLEFISKIAEALGVTVDIGRFLFNKFFKIPVICVLAPAFLFTAGKELLLDDRDLDPQDILDEDETLQDGRLPTEYGVWNRPE